MRKGIASNTSRRKNKNKRSLSPPAQFALEDDSIISVSEGILSTPQRGDGRPETSPSRPRASSFQQDQQYALRPPRPGTSQGLHRQVTFNLTNQQDNNSLNIGSRPGTAPVNINQRQRSSRRRSSSPSGSRGIMKTTSSSSSRTNISTTDSATSTKSPKRRVQSALRRPRSGYMAHMNVINSNRPGTAGYDMTMKHQNASSISNIGKTPPIHQHSRRAMHRNNLNSRGSMNSRDSMRSRGSSRGSSRGGIRNRDEPIEKPRRKKYSRPSTAPIWRVKNEAQEKLEMKKKLKEMYGGGGK